MVTNTTLLTNSTSFSQFLGGLNQSTEYTLGIGICVLISVMVFIAIKGQGYEFMESLSAMSVINLVCAVLLFFITDTEGVGIVPTSYMIGSLLFTAGILFYSMTQK